MGGSGGTLSSRKWCKFCWTEVGPGEKESVVATSTSL